MQVEIKWNLKEKQTKKENLVWFQKKTIHGKTLLCTANEKLEYSRLYKGGNKYIQIIMNLQQIFYQENTKFRIPVYASFRDRVRTEYSFLLKSCVPYTASSDNHPMLTFLLVYLSE